MLSLSVAAPHGASQNAQTSIAHQEWEKDQMPGAARCLSSDGLIRFGLDEFVTFRSLFARGPYICLVLLAVAAFATWFGALSVARHETWQTRGYDLGNADQALWNTMHGRPLAFTNWVGKDEWFEEGQATRLGIHFEPIYFLLVPLYWAWDDVRALLVFQAIAVALGAIPAYRLARRVLDSEAAGLAFAVLYLAHPGLHSLVTSDFHAVALAPPLLLAAFDFLHERRMAPFIVCATLAMMTKENASLAVAGMGVWTWIAQRRRREGALIALGALIWFTVATLLIIPGHNIIGRSPYLARYQSLMAGMVIPDVLRRLLGVSAWRYYLDWLLPLGGLPLFNPLALLPALPELAINLLSEAPEMQVFGRQYVAVLIPVALAASVMGLRTLWSWAEILLPRWRGDARCLSLGLLSVFIVLPLWESPYLPMFEEFEWPRPSAHQRKLREFAWLIPSDASLCTPPDLNPHFTHRAEIHLIPYTFDCDYVLLDVSSYPGNNYGGAQSLLYEKLVKEGTFGVIAADDGYLLFRRGAPPQEFPDRFYTFAMPKTIVTDVRLSGRFGDALELLGYEVEPRSGQAPHLSLYLRALRPLQEDYFLSLYLVEEPGRLVAATVDAQPTLVWYPTSRWKPGRIVKVRVNTLGWELEPGKRYAMAMGWMRGTELWDPSTRLPFSEEDNEAAPRRFQNDTLVYLASFTADGRASIQMRQGEMPEVARPLGVSLAEGHVILSGMDLDATTDALWLHLYWRVIASVDRDYTVFVHVLDGNGQVIAQGDGPPLGGSWPTTRWSAGDLVPDLHVIPLDRITPDGRFSIAVGLYDPVSGQRADVAGEGVHISDQAIWLPVTIEKDGSYLTARYEPQ